MCGTILFNGHNSNSSELHYLLFLSKDFFEHGKRLNHNIYFTGFLKTGLVVTHVLGCGRDCRNCVSQRSVKMAPIIDYCVFNFYLSRESEVDSLVFLK